MPPPPSWPLMVRMPQDHSSFLCSSYTLLWGGVFQSITLYTHGIWILIVRLDLFPGLQSRISTFWLNLSTWIFNRHSKLIVTDIELLISPSPQPILCLHKAFLTWVRRIIIHHFYLVPLTKNSWVLLDSSFFLTIHSQSISISIFAFKTYPKSDHFSLFPMLQPGSRHLDLDYWSFGFYSFST